MTQRELGAAVRALGVELSNGHIAKMEVGDRDNPDAAVMLGVARACGVNYAWLVDGSGTMLGEAPVRTVELDAGAVDPRIAEVGRRIGATADVVRAASSVRGAHGTAGLTDEDIARLLRSIAAADEQATAIAQARGTPVADDDDVFGERPRRRR